MKITRKYPKLKIKNRKTQNNYFFIIYLFFPLGISIPTLFKHNFSLETTLRNDAFTNKLINSTISDFTKIINGQKKKNK